MSKYQVGDVVRVKNGFTECASHFVEEMSNFFGEAVTISHVSPNTEGRYNIAEDPGFWWWSDDCFEGLVDHEDENAISLEGLL